MKRWCMLLSLLLAFVACKTEYVKKKPAGAAKTTVQTSTHRTMANDALTSTTSLPVTTIPRLFAMPQTPPANPGVVHLEWETAIEIKVAGYNILRAESPDGPFIQANPMIIPAQGETIGERHNYEFLDTNLIPDKTYYYELQQVLLSGERKKLGSTQAYTAARQQ